MPSLRVWEAVSNGQPLDSYLQEFKDWMEDERTSLLEAHASTTKAVYEAYAKVREGAARAVGVHDMSTARSIGVAKEFRDAFAAEAGENPHINAMLLTLLEGGDIDRLVWMSLKP